MDVIANRVRKGVLCVGYADGSRKKLCDTTVV